MNIYIFYILYFILLFTDYNFDMNTKNCNVFDNIIKPIVDDVMNGFNGAVFCYGQINSGKTYTMIGTSEDPGIIPLSIEYIFNAISNIINRVFILRYVKRLYIF